MMKAVFIDPPVIIGRRIPERVFGCTYGLYPIPNIFLLGTASFLEKEGHEVKYINAPLKGWNKRDFILFLQEDDSDIILIYSVNLAKDNDLAALEIIRQIRGNVPVVFLGPGPTYEPGFYLKDRKCFVVRGEPELVCAQLVTRLKTPEEVKGISYLNGENKPVDNSPAPLFKDLDLLPFPARHLIEREKYFNPKFGGAEFTAMATSRGCPHRCLYCVPCSLSFAAEIEYKRGHGTKPPYRFRSADNVIKEFVMLKEQGYSNISILDDEFAINKKRIMDICKGIKGLGMKWGCLARADSLQDEVLIKSMSEAGCCYVDIGIESFEQSIIDYTKKNLDVNIFPGVISLLRKYKIMVKLNILFGASPYENKESVRKTLAQVRKLKPDSVMFGICNPFPGTEYYKIAKQNNWFVWGDYRPMDVQKRSNISFPGGLNNTDLERIVHRANLKFFLDPRVILRHIKRIKSVPSFFNNLSSFLKKIT